MSPVPEQLAGLVAQAQFESPLGLMSAAVSARGLAWLNFDAPLFAGVPVNASHPWLAQTGVELNHYWQDGRAAFTLPLDLQGTAFQQAVWQALLGIAPGTTCSYGDIAQRIGRPRAVRAVGLANGRNPVALIVPCHRVIGRDGTLTGYAGGLARKAALLEHESAQQRLP